MLQSVHLQARGGEGGLPFRAAAAYWDNSRVVAFAGCVKRVAPSFAILFLFTFSPVRLHHADTYGDHLLHRSYGTNVGYDVL